MSDEEKWYTSPEEEESAQRRPPAQNRTLFIGVVLGVGLALLLGIVVWALFSGDMAGLRSLFESKSRTMVMSGLIFGMVMLLALVVVAKAGSQRGYRAHPYPRQFGAEGPNRATIAVVIGVIVLILGVVMFFTQF